MIAQKIFEIEITYKCNWDCDYCAVQTHTKKAIQEKEIFENLKNKTSDYEDLKNNVLTITGGEPSLARLSIFEHLIKLSKTYNFQLKLNTNGNIFLQDEKFKNILNNITEINWHVSQDLIWTKSIEKTIEFLRTKNYLINPLIVVSNNNFKNLYSFINNWNNFTKKKLNIIPASDPYGEKIYLDTDKFPEILSSYRKFMTQESQLYFLTKNATYKQKESKITYIENYERKI